MAASRTCLLALATVASAACELVHPSYSGPGDASADRVALDILDAPVDRPPVDVAPVDVAPDAPVDVAPDAPVDVAPDAPVDVAPDAPVDVAPDARVDVAPDAPVDVRIDAPVDVAPDVPVDVVPVCGAGEVTCDGRCVNLTMNSAHCGRCNTVCSPPEVCIGGSCGCPGGARACGGACVSLLTNPNHCGSCGNACSSLQSCVDGACTCGSGRTLCGERCVALANDAMNCGTCGLACGAGTCVGSTCVCPSGMTWCAGRCFDTSTDAMNCGSCGVTCGARSCVGGTCVTVGPTCPANRGDCTADGAAVDPCETDLRNSIQHCGRCGNPCRTGQVCEGGVCTLARSCNEIHQLYPSAPSAVYAVRPSASSVMVWCDMVTDGGGWSVIYLWNNSTRPATTMLNYTVNELALPMAAMRALLAYRDGTNNVVEGNWASFAMPAEWRTMAPFRVRDADRMVAVTTAGGTATRRLRFGYADFNSECRDNWDTRLSAGRICIDGTNAPFFASFSPVSYPAITADRCSNSNQRWDTTACSPGRRFSIAVR